MNYNNQHYKAWDIMSFIIVVVMLLFIHTNFDNFFADLIAKFFMFIIYMAFIGLIGLRWISRYKAHKKRERLLALPVQTMQGTMIYSGERKVGTTTMSVPSGSSYNPKTGDVYYHNTYEEFGVYDGYKIIFHTENTYDFIEVASLPRSFWGDEEVLPFMDRGPVNLSYVRDSDGTYYYIEARYVS